MCAPGQPAAMPASAAEALTVLEGALDYLNSADAASLPAAEQASCLKALERAESKHTAARAAVLAAFSARATFQDDGQYSARAWLTWQTGVTTGAAAGAVGWMRRIAGHPAVGTALAAGGISASWARKICDWTSRLPGDKRDDADAILLGAAAGGADLAAVIDALGQKAGPEDERTKRQRDHDALEEACARLIASGMLPERAGQPTSIQLHMTLRELRGLGDGSGMEDAWSAAGAAGHGWLAGPGADAAACDAAIVPVVSGHVDYAVHVRGRKDGGPTCLKNLILLYRFHHLIAVHRWGWTITLHPDGTVTARSPGGQRVLHSHVPPARAA